MKTPPLHVIKPCYAHFLSLSRGRLRIVTHEYKDKFGPANAMRVWSEASNRMVLQWTGFCLS